MNTTAVTVTLSRAHKLSERIKAHTSELLNQAKAGLGERQVPLTGQHSSVSRLTADATASVALFKEARRWAEAGASLRHALAVANISGPVSELLARGDALNRVLSATREAYIGLTAAVARGNVLHPNDALPEASDFQRSAAMVGLEPEEIAAFGAEVDALQREAYQIADSLAEANAQRITFELPQDIASAISA